MDTPVEPGTTVSRSTVGDCYAQILSDLDKALAGFNEVGDRRSLFAFGKASTLGLMAREADARGLRRCRTGSCRRLAAKGISTLTYDPEAYEALYAYSNNTNTESFLALAIDEKTNWAPTPAAHSSPPTIFPAPIW